MICLRHSCADCGAYVAPYCYGIELKPGSECELEKPYKTTPGEWCCYWQRKKVTEWNGKKVVR